MCYFCVYILCSRYEHASEILIKRPHLGFLKSHLKLGLFLLPRVLKKFLWGCEGICITCCFMPLPIKQDTLSLDVLALFARGRGTFRCGFARRLRREKPSAQYQDLREWLPLLPIGVVHDSKWSILDGSICEKHIRINRSINQKCKTTNHPFPRLDLGDGIFRFDLKTYLYL